MDQREINEKRYEIAASQTSSVMLVGLFSNLAIFAITAFADLSSGAQTDWEYLATLRHMLKTFLQMKTQHGTEMLVKHHLRSSWLLLQ
jgi:hypothetical protein